MGGSRSRWVWKGGEGEQAESTTAACWGFWVAQLWGVQTRPPSGAGEQAQHRWHSFSPSTSLKKPLCPEGFKWWRVLPAHTDCLNVYLPAPLKKNSCCISTPHQQSAILPQPPTWPFRVYFSFAKNPSSGKGSTADCHGQQNMGRARCVPGRAHINQNMVTPHFECNFLC